MVKIKNTIHKWGGDWTEKKLDAFIGYVKAYLTIMNKHKVKYGWKTIYFDGFAGSGEGNHQDSNDVAGAPLFDNEINSEENKVYQGSAERVIAIEGDGFDYIYLIEKDEESIEKLKQKLNIYDTTRVQFRAGDANSQLKELAKTHNRDSKYKSLIFLDPFGMEILWESIECLKNTSSDVWILVPTGVIINRLLDKKGELKYIEKLKAFFGLTEQEIRSYFYPGQQQQTLFGEEIVREKIPQAIPKIAELYVCRLKTIWKYVTEKPLVLSNSNKVPIFHFVFASNNPTAIKIASDIIK